MHGYSGPGRGERSSNKLNEDQAQVYSKGLRKKAEAFWNAGGFEKNLKLFEMKVGTVPGGWRDLISGA